MIETEQAIREKVAYWDEKAEDAGRAANYANNQLRLAVEQLAALGGVAMSENENNGI